MTNQTNLLLTQYAVGDRVQIGPHTDAWMRGDRFGTVTKIGRFYLHVALDHSGKTRKFVPENMIGKVTTR